ncbi:hypothetical protein K443DRAFT_12659 [Laccaria amethystina LaAM-08-1]|uniref:Uncharacterized protein n=1 Tax=Laccaria amethystina LaAM-08-1 TaxID=1095629 RepID=A0A0C9XBV4_9AGAR|nr:hypothetical protein K443DRAFT_12659 [Laccaria amethystina LaAM-08-1]
MPRNDVWAPRQQVNQRRRSFALVTARWELTANDDITHRSLFASMLRCHVAATWQPNEERRLDVVAKRDDEDGAHRQHHASTTPHNDDAAKQQRGKKTTWQNDDTVKQRENGEGQRSENSEGQRSENSEGQRRRRRPTTTADDSPASYPPNDKHGPHPQ